MFGLVCLQQQVTDHWTTEVAHNVSFLPSLIHFQVVQGNGTDRLAQCRVSSNLQLVIKKKSVKHNKAKPNF